jgi:hypothetical protein
MIQLVVLNRSRASQAKWAVYTLPFFFFVAAIVCVLADKPAWF